MALSFNRTAIVDFFSRHRKRFALLSIVLALMGASAGAYQYYRPDQQLAKIKELSAQLRGEASRNLPPEQRRDLGRQLREQMQSLSPAQRDQLWQERQARAREEMRKFFKLSKEEQKAYLDRLIQQGEERRQQMEERRQQMQAQNANQQNSNQQAMGQPGPGQGRQGPPRTGSDEDRERRRKEFLDRTTPEDRAMRAEFRKMMNEERKALGLPPLTGRGGRGGPGGGGGWGGPGGGWGGPRR
jgi:hypothetical protein